MHRLRTCAARLRPLTSTQNAQSFSQQKPKVAHRGLRTFQPIRCYTAPVAAEPFLNGTSSNYVEEMYYAWLENPKSVHKVRCCLGMKESGPVILFFIFFLSSDLLMDQNTISQHNITVMILDINESWFY